MSSRIGSVASRPTWVRRTEPIGASAVSERFSHAPKYRRQADIGAWRGYELVLRHASEMR